MAAIYGFRWTSAYGEDANTIAGREWAVGLATMTLDQIKRGIDACNDGHGPEDGWPPTLPQFRELCLGLPTVAEIRAEIAKRDGERSPFGLLVSRKMTDPWAYRQADARTSERMLAEAYAAARAHVLAGGELPVILPALPDQTDREPTPASPEVAAAALAAVREMLDGAPPVHWREDRGRWVATLRTAGDREARASVTPPAAEGGPWRWCVMVAGDVVEAGEVADGEAGKVAAVRCAAGVAA
jgi:hypothetical protein